MPDSASNSEVFFLHALWQTSIALALLSLLVMVTLIIRRVLENRRRQRQETRRDLLARAMQAALTLPMLPTATGLPQLKKRDRPMVFLVALNLLRSLRGQDEQRIVHILKTWDMMPYLRRTLAHGSRGPRIQVLTLFSHFDDEESLGLLQRYTDNADPYVQLSALRGLASRNAQESLLKIIPQLAHSQQRNTIMLADILQRFGEAAVPALILLASGNALPEIRLAGITALGAIGSLEAVHPLMMLTLDPLPDIRAQAVSTLGRINDMRAEPAIMRTLDDADEAVRIQAAQAAGLLTLQAAMPKLLDMLDDTSWWLRYRAAEALIRLGVPGIALLRNVAEQGNKTGRMVQMVLAEKGV